MSCRRRVQAPRQNIAKRAKTEQEHSMAYVVIQQHKFGRMYLCGWSKRWGATVCANRFVAIKYPTEDEAKLARDHAATRCPNFTDGRPIDWQVLELPPTLDSLPRRDEEAG